MQTRSVTRRRRSDIIFRRGMSEMLASQHAKSCCRRHQRDHQRGICGYDYTDDGEITFPAQLVTVPGVRDKPRSDIPRSTSQRRPQSRTIPESRATRPFRIDAARHRNKLGTRRGRTGDGVDKMLSARPASAVGNQVLDLLVWSACARLFLWSISLPRHFRDKPALPRTRRSVGLPINSLAPSFKSPPIAVRTSRKLTKVKPASGGERKSYSRDVPEFKIAESSTTFFLGNQAA